MAHKITGHTKITGVIGKNIAYTQSPIIHNYWYQQHEIDGVYVCFQADETNFTSTVRGLFQAGIQGLNVTVPFKEAAFKLCDDLSDDAIHAQAVNCLMVKNNKIYGHNTDGAGFYNALCALNPSLDLNGKSVLMIGAGGAASAIIAYLSQFNVTINILNRTFEKALLLAKNMGNNANIHVISKPCHADIIIQTTNVKIIEPNSILDIPDDLISKAQAIIDINYGQGTGSFLKKPTILGVKNCDGLEMLLQQAVPAFKLFNNHTVNVTNSLRTLVKSTSL
ncbi:MAG: shikimate dehydrogenase [Alphaproteobacteria bacterium]|jgi:shikimate dehydrogenase